jgi:hypothetical protein
MPRKTIKDEVNEILQRVTGHSDLEAWVKQVGLSRRGGR